MSGTTCKHCKEEFKSVAAHERQCAQRLPWVYRRALPLARSRIKGLGFDQRTSEGRIFRYAVLRYYVDSFEFILAVAVIIGRLYLMLPLDEWFEASLPFAGAVKPGWSDAFVFGWSVWTIFSRFNLLKDYRRNVVTRLEKISARKPAA